MADETKSPADEEEFRAKYIPDDPDTLGGRDGVKEPPHPGLIRHILSHLRPGQDLTRVTIPSFFLENRSFLEKITDFWMHPDILFQIPTLKAPEDRALAMAKWMLSGWHYKTKGVKKPYNSVIGETFACEWRHKDSNSQFFAEQVSHRPPVSGFYFENRKKGVVVNGQVWTKSKFKAPQTAVSIFEGGCNTTLTNLQEEYRITFPSYFAHGLLIGTLRTEIGGDTVVYCEKTGFRVDITFHQKSMWGGEYHVVSGTVINSKTNQKVYKFKGKWNESFKVTDLRTKKETPWFDVRELPVAAKYCLPESMQGPWESRRLWHNVTKELNARPTVDWDAVDREKSVLEEAQRELPCHKTGDEYGEWSTKKFHLKPFVDPVSKKEIAIYVFDHINTAAYKEGDQTPNFVRMSQTLRDVRTPDDKTGATEAEAGGAGAGAGAGAGSGAGAGAGSGAGAGAGAGADAAPAAST